MNHDLLQTLETADEAGSVILSESPLSMPESSLTFEQPTASVRNKQEYFNQPRRAECFVLTAVQTGVETKTPESTPQTAPSPLRTFLPRRGSERSEQNQHISVAKIKTISSEQQNEIVMEMNDGSVQQRRQETGTLQSLDALGQNRVAIDTTQRSTLSEDYLQPVDSNKLQVAIISADNSRLCPGKAQALKCHVHPQPKSKMTTSDRSFPLKHPTFTGTLSNLQFTEMLKSNPLHCRGAAQQCVRVNCPNQSNHLFPEARTCHAKHHGYQNEKLSATPYKNALQPAESVESPYTPVLCDGTKWEVPKEHLSLMEKIGGGSFGKVWKGAVLDVAGAQGWSIVAVKMLKGKQERPNQCNLQFFLCIVVNIILDPIYCCFLCSKCVKLGSQGSLV